MEDNGIKLTQDESNKLRTLLAAKQKLINDKEIADVLLHTVNGALNRLNNSVAQSHKIKNMNKYNYDFTEELIRLQKK